MRRRPLDGDQREVFCAVDDVGAAHRMLPHPVQILVRVGGIDHEHVILGTKAINEEVIDDASVGPAHDGVERPAVIEC